MKKPRYDSLKGLEDAKKLSDLKAHYEQDVAKLVNDDAILLRRATGPLAARCLRSGLKHTLNKNHQ